MNDGAKWLIGIAAVAALLAGVGYATRAKAADKGADSGFGELEERIAELEATVARKGNRKVSLTISGAVSKAVMWTDGLDGFEANHKLRVIDNANSGTRINLKGEATISPTMKAGFAFEYGFDETRGMGLGPVAGPLVHWLGGTAEMRRSAVWLESSLGRVTVGKFSLATDAITEIDTSNSGIASRMLSIEPVWSYIGLSGLPLIGGNLLNPMPFHDLRAEVIRYDSPALAGFTASASWGGGQTLPGDDLWDVALRYAGEFGGFRVAAGAGYRVEQYGNLLSLPEQRTMSGSASAMHMDSGFFVTLAAASQKDNPIFGDIRTWHAKAGWQKNVFGIGPTTLYGEYADHKLPDMTINSSFIGAGAVQAVDAAALDLFLSVRQYKSDVFSGDATTVLGGMRIAF